MPCPFSSGAPDLSAFTRRDVLKRSLALGGMSALAACVESRGMPDVPQGPADPETLPDRQYAWNEYLPHDSHGRLILPRHQLVMLLDYAGTGTPEDDEREAVEATLTSLERAYQRGNGGVDPQRPGGSEAPGLLYTLGYSPSYFDRFDAQLPDDVDLPPTERVVSAIDEPPEHADEYDAAMVLTSDHVQVLLAVELALFGERESLNEVSMAGSFDGIFEKRARRSGFIGPGVPKRELDREDVPEKSPLGMGFVSGFGDNQASEAKVALRDGPFAGGTTQHVSRLTLDLDSWYEHDHEERVSLMFSPDHSPEEVGDVGEFLADDSGLTRDIADNLADDAAHEGTVGHSQKLAAARDDDFEPLLLRRSEALSADADRPGFNFTSLQRSIDHFVDVRKAMNRDVDVPADRDGIRHYLGVESRGNYLVPPRRLAALPPADPA